MADEPLPPLPSEPRPGRYRHYKGGEYQVTGIARHSETLEPMVVYQALYGAGGLWVRPAGMFTEVVVTRDHPDGILRFRPSEGEPNGR